MYFWAWLTVPVKQWITTAGSKDWCLTRISTSCWWASLSCKNMGIFNSQAIFTCFSKTSSWTSCGEKFRLKSRPHSPMATHSGFFASSYICSSVWSVHVLASWGWIPENESSKLTRKKFVSSNLLCNTNNRDTIWSISTLLYFLEPMFRWQLFFSLLKILKLIYLQLKWLIYFASPASFDRCTTESKSLANRLSVKLAPMSTII